LPSSSNRAASPAQPEDGASAGSSPAAGPPGPAPSAAEPGTSTGPVAAATGPATRNWPATAALVCGILGGALITIPAGLVLGVLGLRRAVRTGRGRVRCWVVIALSLAWAGAAGYLVPHLAAATDPGCMAYKDSALTAYNRVVADVSRGAGRDVLTTDLTSAVRQIDDAATDSRDAATTRSLHAVSAGLRTVLADVRAGAAVTRQVLLKLNHDTDRADAARATLRV